MIVIDEIDGATGAGDNVRYKFVFKKHFITEKP